MRWVPVPSMQPQRCAFMPTIAGFAAKGFIEGDQLPFGDRAYISVEAVEQIAAKMGWAPAGRDLNAAKIARLEREKTEKDARIVELEQQLAAVEVLRNGAFVQARKPGRPKATA